VNRIQTALENYFKNNNQEGSHIAYYYEDGDSSYIYDKVYAVSTKAVVLQITKMTTGVSIPDVSTLGRRS
jgi:hypothetical protein